MLRLVVLGVVFLALASRGQAEEEVEDLGLFRRFMDSVMGSQCGAFGCKRDVEVSRAVRDYAENLREADEMMKRSEEEEETANQVRELHRRLSSFADAESTLVEQVREQSRRLSDYAKRALEERDADPLQMAVRSIMEYAEESKREEELEEERREEELEEERREEELEEERREEELEEERREEELEEERREEEEWQEAKRQEEEREEERREATNEVKRTLMDLHGDIDDLKRRDVDQMQVRAPLAFARRAFDENERMARAINELYEALEEKR